MKARQNMFFQLVVLLALAGTGIIASCSMGRTSPGNMKTGTTSAKEIAVTGIALHARAGAVVKTETGEVYYVKDKQSWGALENKRVKVTGKLVTERHKEEDLKDEKGNHMPGMSGDVSYIEHALVEEVE